MRVRWCTESAKFVARPGRLLENIYGKGAWVFHMLRVMLQAPASKNPDERFIGVLHSLMESHRYRALSTEDLQKAVERVMTPAMDLEGGRSMDWFFEQFVRSTGVTAYELEYTVRPGPKGFLVRGTLIQKNVPDDFVLSVPIYEQAQGAKPVLFGPRCHVGRRDFVSVCFRGAAQAAC